MNGKKAKRLARETAVTYTPEQMREQKERAQHLAGDILKLQAGDYNVTDANDRTETVNGVIHAIKCDVCGHRHGWVQQTNRQAEILEAAADVLKTLNAMLPEARHMYAMAEQLREKSNG